jgi:hypothetical protein
MGNLMTASLLDAYKWLQEAPAGKWQNKALEDLTAKIRREDTFEANDAIARGMAFEKAICSNLALDRKEFVAKCSMLMSLKNGTEHAEANAGKFWEVCHAGQQQVKVTGNITVDGMEFYLFGFADIAQPNITVDIKTTGNYKGPQSYTSKNQHLIYEYCRDVYDFCYIVADYEGGEFVEHVHVIPIKDEKEQVLHKLKGRLQNFKHWMEDSKLMDDYLSKFCRKGRF